MDRIPARGVWPLGAKRPTLTGSRRPPGPRGSWHSGNLAAYEADRLKFLIQAREQFGVAVRFGKRTTMLFAPAAVASVLRATEDFVIRENFLQRRLSSAEQTEVRSLRTALSPGLRVPALDQVPAMVDRHLGPAVDRLGTASFDPLPVMESVISCSVAELYFGPDGAPLPAMLAELLDELSRVIGNPFALPEGWGSRTRRRIGARYELLRAQVERLLAARVGPRPGAIDDLATGVVSRAGGRHSLSRLADMVIGSLLASQRVPAAAASWMLMTLADHPRIQEQIAAEKSSLLPVGGAASRTDPVVAQRMVLEVLRLYPPTWLLVRTASCPVEVAGYSFAAGHHFMISPYVQHRDAEVFVDPDTFRPERWIQPPPSAGQYLPFGGGLHMCPGRHLATTILIAIAQGLTTRYRIVRTSAQVTPNPRTTLLPDGLRTALRPAHRRLDQLPALAGASSPR